MSFIRFLSLLLAISLSGGIVGWMFFSEPYSFFYRTIIFLFLGTVGVYFYAIEIKKRAAEYFISFYLLIMFIKVLLYGAYAFFIIQHDAAQATPNIIFFLLVYFLFTALEVYFLYRELDKQKSE